MFLLAYAILFTNIAIILRLVLGSCRVVEETYNHSDISEDDEDSSESEINEEDDELLRAFILNNKKRKRAERVSPNVSRPTTPTIPEDDQSKEPTFYETF
jgi:hypothetical protein